MAIGKLPGNDSGPVRVDGKFFAVGDRRFRFRGVTYGTFAPRDDGALVPARDRIKRDFADMAEAGFTVVRTYTEPPADLLELAADHGLRLLAGAHWVDWRYLAGASRRQQRSITRAGAAAVRQAAERLSGCDSVLAVCVGNEVPADVVRWLGTAPVAAAVGELVDAVRSADADRLVTYANYPSTEYLAIADLDFVTFNVFLEDRVALSRYLTRLHHLAGDRPLVLGETGLHAGHDGPGGRGERRQAEAIDWQLATVVERGVAGACLFSWTDDWWVGGQPVTGWRFGLTRHDRSPRPALAVAQRWNDRTVADLAPAGGWPPVSVVVCAYNAAATLHECLRHACALDYPGLEVVVVDDGSTDDTAAVALRHPRARLVRIRHAGLSAARNAGFEAARSEIVAYLDADAYPAPEWPYFLALAFGERQRDGRPVAGAGGPNVPPPSDPPGAQRVARAPGGPVHVLVGDDRAEHLPGCNMAFRKAVLEESGGFVPVFTAAGDDVDFCWRVLDAGHEIAFHPAALVWHHRRPGARTYLRQQRGYGRAEALVAARHPARFNGLGAARWQGRIYNPLTAAAKASDRRGRVYRGRYGTAAYQSVYGAGGSGLDAAHQLGVPLALAGLATAPLAALAPWPGGVPAAAGAAALAALFAVDAARAEPPSELPGNRVAFRLSVAALCLAQPVVRHWGRATTAAAARRDLPPVELPGPVRRLPGGAVAVPAEGDRAATTERIIAALRRAGLPVAAAGDWEARDGVVTASALVAGDVVTSGFPAGFVQVRVRRRLRTGAAAVALAAVAAGAAAAGPRAALAVAAVCAADVAVGIRRSGGRVRAALETAASSAAAPAGEEQP